MQTPIRRHLAPVLLRDAERYPVVSLTGPRQSGKTTLVRLVFPDHRYVSLEDPDARAFAHEDPRGFLGQFGGPVILDEAQQAPALFSYIQGIVDETKRPGQFVLSGSQNFLLLERIGQSLAGRSAVRHLLPLSQTELSGMNPQAPDALGASFPDRPRPAKPLMAALFNGGYPRIHESGIPAQDWLRNYYQTYLERDVRDLLQVGDIEAFGRFVRLCAGRTGQLLNLSSLGADCGVSQGTAKRWLSTLEASFVVTLLRPHFANFNKRLVKTPKLYFVDTGLLCYLLRIRSPEDLIAHGSRGAVFESFVVSETMKAFLHSGREPDMYFWRDSKGLEIDLLLDFGARLVPVEIKSGETVASDFFDGLNRWRTLADRTDSPAALVYGGTSSMMRNGVAVYGWHDWA